MFSLPECGVMLGSSGSYWLTAQTMGWEKAGPGRAGPKLTETEMGWHPNIAQFHLGQPIIWVGYICYDEGFWRCRRYTPVVSSSKQNLSGIGKYCLILPRSCNAPNYSIKLRHLLACAFGPETLHGEGFATLPKTLEIQHLLLRALLYA